ncbi:hypothetical protein SAMN05428940_4643 [Streptomyces sp. 2133.1]|nr:hypothetical protein BX261_4616 [Streptomyces sp. 2321.6]SED38220.1 hypothetical protein SAMN05428940_4643 [Streptomyces sp. 2133.1]
MGCPENNGGDHNYRPNGQNMVCACGSTVMNY